MKHRIFGALSMLAATMVFALPTLHAQSRIVANVPFNFYLGQKAMAAGSYQVLSISDQVDLVENMDTDAAAFLVKAIHIQAVHDQGARLVFNKYGNQYFLSQIWDGRSDVGLQLPKSKREKEIRLTANGLTKGPDTVIVAMK